MTVPLISVIIPAYNTEKTFLLQCINSLKEQTYSKLEILVIDDGSTMDYALFCDGLERMDSRIHVYHKKNGGLSDARNFGVEQAVGKYIVFVDSDDYVDNDYIKYLIDLRDKYGTQMSICQHRVRFANGTFKDKGQKGNEILNAQECIEKMLYHDLVDTSAWAKLYDIRLFETIKFPVGKLFEDIGTTYKAFLASGKIAVGYESKYVYNFHMNSIVNSEFNSRKLDLLIMTDDMSSVVMSEFPELQLAVERRRMYARISTLNQMLDVTGNHEKNERNKLLKYIKDNKESVLRNSKTPKRDKLALRLLSINYHLYRFCWKSYQSYIMKERL